VVFDEACQLPRGALLGPFRLGSEIAVFVRCGLGSSGRLCVRGEGVTTTAGPSEAEEDSRVAMLREELACRDEIILALQHVIRDLRHELENLRVEHVYGLFACEASVDERERLVS
jgi:hypothetical protein